MTDKGTTVLETERLILRRFKMSDAEAMFRNLYSDVDAMRFLPWEPHTTVSETEAHLAGYIAGYERQDFYAWAIVPKNSDKPIGFIDTAVDSTINAIKVDYGIGKPWWHKGFTSSALSELIRFSFEEIEANRVYATHDPRNPNSGKVMEKCGMKYEGTLRQTRCRKGEYSDRAMYALLAEDYFGKPEIKISIVPYAHKYHDDMLFCFLSAKDAIGRYAPKQWSRPTLKDDLLEIEENYTERGDVFYLAIDERDRVVGMIGTQTVSPTDLWLKRLFIKPEVKCHGIGSKLLSSVENYAAEKGVTTIHTRFAYWYREAAVFYPAKGFVEAESNEHLRHMVKRLE